MNFGLIKDGICINAIVLETNPTPEDIEILIPSRCDELIELPEGFGIRDFYNNGVWSKEPFLTPPQKREKAYQEMTLRLDGSPLIVWDNQNITVDGGNKLYFEYFAEKSEKADEIQAMIIEAKNYIRELYPDEV